MFRVTIYSIVAYAFWLTFSDMSDYFNTQAHSDNFSKNQVETVIFPIENSDRENSGLEKNNLDKSNMRLKTMLTQVTASNVNIIQCEDEEDCGLSLLVAAE
ncbi:hypothetical protein Sps_01535 [Shewanella psychrophila]|uniref:Uncharacterized protein n=1 Tax=Shewanella psychrophila TaxID=225848 RepID=A0A1S6HME5_9GAMM|nr:hypothetical protein [Shewanella psychrophila]AQS36701.1 hypothetical protein Sps_01535 [Shewanella psychrophila]